MKIYNLTVLTALLCIGCIKTTTEFPIELMLSESSTTISPAGGEFSFSISSNTTNWTVDSNVSTWLTISPANGSANGEVKINVSVNSSSSSRTAVITVNGAGAREQSLHLTQLADSRVFGNGIIAANSFESGNGTQNDPYLIQNSYQLKKLVDGVNEGNTFVNTYFKLMTDIEVTADEWIPVGNNIGNNAFFRGQFDGNNHIISGTMISNRFNYFGFFGLIKSGARISNLSVHATIKNDGYFTSSSEEIRIYAGSITGGTYDQDVIIDNCHASGNITGGIANKSFTGGILGATNGGVIQNCDVSNMVIRGNGEEGVWIQAGGIVGINFEGEILNCTVTDATIIGGEYNSYGTQSRAGGITGENHDRITNCTNHAHVAGTSMAGGIVGANFGIIHTCLNVGDISGFSYNGGLAGYNEDVIEEGFYGKIFPCCTNLGEVNAVPANSNNQIGVGKPVEPACPDGHSKR